MTIKISLGVGGILPNSANLSFCNALLLQDVCIYRNGAFAWYPLFAAQIVRLSITQGFKLKRYKCIIRYINCVKCI